MQQPTFEKEAAKLQENNNQDHPKHINPQIEPGWKKALTKEFESEYFRQIKSFLLEEKKKNVTIYPPGPEIFNAFNLTPFDHVKAVILGQDPYHGKGQAHGLCFSVKNGVKPPPSLVNIYKELHNDIGFEIPDSGNLTRWTRQGVLLLNAILTVRAGQPASHRNIGWENFTDAAIRAISEKREHVVFLLWGKFAQNKDHLIDSSKHLVLKAAHPSPYSANNGFFGCRHFSKTNSYLSKNGKEPIDWELL